MVKGLHSNNYGSLASNRDEESRRERSRDEGRERNRGNGHRDSQRRHESDWDQETPRTERRYGGETPYSKIKGKKGLIIYYLTEG